jgi:hypothetical protein
MQTLELIIQFKSHLSPKDTGPIFLTRLPLHCSVRRSASNESPAQPKRNHGFSTGHILSCLSKAMTLCGRCHYASWMALDCRNRMWIVSHH